MGKKKKKVKDEGGDDEDGDDTIKEKVEKDDVMTLIKRDYLNMDFTVYTTCQEILQALKDERMKAKYSAEYHVEVLQKIFTEMPCVESYEIQMKVSVINLMVGTIFQTAKSSSYLKRDEWCTIHDKIKELLRLAQTPSFIKALKEAHAPIPEKPEGQSDEEQEK